MPGLGLGGFPLGRWYSTRIRSTVIMDVAVSNKHRYVLLSRGKKFRCRYPDTDTETQMQMQIQIQIRRRRLGHGYTDTETQMQMQCR